MMQAGGSLNAAEVDAIRMGATNSHHIDCQLQPKRINVDSPRKGLQSCILKRKIVWDVASEIVWDVASGFGTQMVQLPGQHTHHRFMVKLPSRPEA